ncbi:4-oxalocrotonate tautomerase [Arthrobacter psychrolactophilus]|uniref:4-oxalocrotonate tautomerase n=1 Tax=Arthrobacter psychrolactophilus TaxID=92442 RepID=A0A2V5IT77_9MICC|nr:2-hydroxymuconate tautomerase [Arthrobacter psychrolactophilus]PYI37353.1 4-oxalocrotonate tautomerase [Arthrobacter psychrolactophilus]
MPLIQISLIEGRKPEQIRNLIRDVTNTVHESIDAPFESIQVVVTEVAATHWGSGERTVAEKRAQTN